MDKHFWRWLSTVFIILISIYVIQPLWLWLLVPVWILRDNDDKEDKERRKWKNRGIS